MPRTDTIKIFELDELSEKAKERARDWWREGQGHMEWWDSIFEDAKTIAELLGIHIDDIAFSGFSSQGDGACFKGRWSAGLVKFGGVKEHAPIDDKLHRIADAFEAFATKYPDSHFSVTPTGRYSHAYATSFEVGFGDDPIDALEYGSPEYKAREVALLEAEKEIIEAARDFMNWIYAALEEEHDWQQADEQVDDSIRANDYVFYEDGERAWRHDAWRKSAK